MGNGENKYNSCRVDEGRLTQKPWISGAKVHFSPRYLKTCRKKVFDCKGWFIVILSKLLPMGAVFTRAPSHK